MNSSDQRSQPWQLQMFRRSLKKQHKLNALLEMLRSLSGQQCLLVTCGDNNGALNWHFRAHGGTWTWGDAAGENLAEIGELLGEPIHHVQSSCLPWADGEFDRVVSIDTLEHLEDDLPFLRELYRVLHPEGQAIVTVPNGDPRLLANRIKRRVGMTPNIYGHTRPGYTVAELSDSMRRVGFEPVDHSSYSRFFTEMVELAINFGYVFILSRKRKDAEPGHIAPTSSGEFQTHGLAYRFYSSLYPLLRLLTWPDRLLSAETGNAVIVKAVKGRASD
jgi:SAM-dependent methyltransferase